MKKKILHYVLTDYKSGGLGGVPRFDDELHKIFPELITVCKNRHGIFSNTSYSKEDCIVITDNGMCLDVPNHIPCIVVHHGMARTHKERSPKWAGDMYVTQQDQMVKRDNTYFVGCSDFTKTEFKKYYGLDDFDTILHGVETVPAIEPIKGNKIIVDCRNDDKGRKIIDELKKISSFEFINLKCGKYDKANGYTPGNIYVSLSLSEGNSYSMMDAIACGLPVLGTNVGLFGGNYDSRIGEMIDWKDRSNYTLIEDKLNYIYNNYENYDPIGWMNETISFEKWGKQWKELIKKIECL